MRILLATLATALFATPAGAGLPPGPNPWVGGTLAQAVATFGPPLTTWYEPAGAQVFVWPGSPPERGRGGFADAACQTGAIARGSGLDLNGWVITEVKLFGIDCH